MTHPKGLIEVSLYVENDHLQGTVALPDGVEGVFKYEGKSMRLKAGTQHVHF